MKWRQPTWGVTAITLRPVETDAYVKPVRAENVSAAVTALLTPGVKESSVCSEMVSTGGGTGGIVGSGAGGGSGGGIGSGAARRCLTIGLRWTASRTDSKTVPRTIGIVVVSVPE